MSLSSWARGLALCLLAVPCFAPLGCNSAGGQESGGSGVSLSGPPTILAKYQARAPRTCTSVTAVPSVAQATAMVQCSMDGLGDTGLSLVQDVQIQMGTPRVFVYNTDAGLAGIDLNAKVYPLRGSYTTYFCQTVGALNPAATSCAKTVIAEQQGWCWKTSFGDYKCTMHAGAATMGRGPGPKTY